MTYLTIDLDYWDRGENTGFFEVQENFIEEGKEFIDLIKSKFKDIYIVDYHHEILDHIHSFSNVDKIINIDFHSDIANEPLKDSDLDEGTWANFVNGREEMTFEWRMPDRQLCLIKGEGRCDSFLACARIQKDLMGYKKIYFREGIQRINFEKICGVSICKSPDWTHKTLEKYL